MWPPSVTLESSEAYPAVNVEAVYSTVLKRQYNLRLEPSRYPVKVIRVVSVYALGLVHIASRSLQCYSLHAEVRLDCAFFGPELMSANKTSCNDSFGTLQRSQQNLQPLQNNVCLLQQHTSEFLGHGLRRTASDDVEVRR